MNKTMKDLLVIGIASLSSACVSMKSPSSPSDVHATTDTTGEHYVARRNVLVGGVPLVSTDNTCVDQFNFLKKQGDAGYSQYASAYNQINQGYTFLNVNKNIMDKDAREIYAMNLSIKLDTLCAKVRYSGFRLVKDRMKALSGI